MAPAPRHSIQEQESIILEAAVQCISDTSILDFGMLALAKEAGLSMGSIYKHIQTKEDVLLALAARNLEHLRKIITETLALPLTIPERMIAVFLFSREKTSLYNFAAQLQMLVANEAIMRRTSPHWLSRTARLEDDLEQTFRDAFAEAWRSGELQVTEADRDRVIEELQVGLSSLHSGSVQVSMMKAARDRILDRSPRSAPIRAHDALVQCAKRLMNTYPWTAPLTDEGIEKAKALISEKGFR